MCAARLSFDYNTHVASWGLEIYPHVGKVPDGKYEVTVWTVLYSQKRQAITTLEPTGLKAELSQG